MKILLLGANGQVGFELARSLAPLGELVCASRSGTLAGAAPCLATDLARPESLAATLDAVKADVIVNAAAYTAVDRAEDESVLAQRVNAQALAEIGAYAAAHNALAVHYSTDYVFDGAGSRPYRENDATAPLGVYGRSKRDGENALRASGCDHLILRTAWVYAARGHNFLHTMLRLARERDELRVVGDQRGAPTPARLISAATAVALARLLARRAGEREKLLGTYHLCAAGQCTWFDFAGAIFARALAAGLIARAPRLVPISTTEYPTRARRPAYSVLDCSKIRDAFGLHLPEWRAGLDAVIGELAG
ncbi:MAG: dTDP-4-dehydrorhamnose reductase [Xanthomonadaceae bacterium]|nr:dTDP-4-dehydrorhamnose reductase [Xanthomonadaceae bacterium]MDE1885596.1 dTDP-4-dehydrorhamnose reductase [Xanthomonadaceae bacterium]MDE2084909.1 dTDP-4-dehydrorhamnose reductase [Xanthomonadaceae bacterium]